MTPARIPRLVLEDYPKEQQSWLESLFQVLNQLISATVTSLNGGITFGENIAGMQRVVSFTFRSATLSFPQGFAWTLDAKPIALSVVAATEDGVPVLLQVAWQYTQKGQVQIVDAVKFTSSGPSVSALTAGAAYQIIVRVSP